MKKSTTALILTVFLGFIGLFFGSGEVTHAIQVSIQEQEPSPQAVQEQGLSVPAAPINLFATLVSTSEINLDWIDSSSNETGFIIERKKDNGSYIELTRVSANATNYYDEGLTPGSVYDYRVKAINEKGSSGYSNEVSIIAEIVSELIAPSNLTASAVSESEISLSWLDNSDGEELFLIYRKSANQDYKLVSIVPTDSLTFTDSKLLPNTTYYYIVLAFKDASTYSEYSEEISATTLPTEHPGKTIRLYIDNTQYLVDGIESSMDIAPIVRNGRTLLPIRYVAEPLGAQLDWDSSEQKVSLSLENTLIEVWINNNIARVNGEIRYIDPDNEDVQPILVPTDRTMLPLRFIAENLGCLVDWNGSLREVTVQYGGAVS